MAVFLNDTFTDTDATSLASHTPDTGSAWEAMAFGTGGRALGSDLQTLSNRCRTPNLSDNGSVYRNSTDPGADEYDVAATFQFRATSQTNRILELCWRMSATGTAGSAVDRYFLWGDNGPAQEWQLYKTVAGTTTLLDSAAAALAGNSFAVVVEVRDGSMEVFLDGSGTPVVSSTDTAITQRGRAGVGAARGDPDHWIDDLSADSVAAGGSADGGKFTIAGALNRIAGTVGYTEAGAANVAAGTTTLSLAGALNVLAGTAQLTEAGAANALNGTTDRTLAGALNEYLESL